MLHAERIIILHAATSPQAVKEKTLGGDAEEEKENEGGEGLT